MTEQHVCPVCGKKFWVDYPQLWRFKADGKFVCRWNCKREMDKRKEADEMAQMRNSTKETARELLAAMEAGTDPMEWLKGKGYTNPEKAYQNIKARIKDRDPELAKRFPKMRAGRKQAAEAKKEAEEQTVELVYDPSIAEEYRREQRQKEAEREGRQMAEHPMVNVKEKPAEDFLAKYLKQKEAAEQEQREKGLGNRLLWKTTAIWNEQLGEFYYDRKFRTIDWRNPEGDEVSIPPEDWKMLSDAIPMILHVLDAEG